MSIHSLDFAGVHAQQLAGDWSSLGADLGDAAAALQRGGAEAVAVCANTLHLVADAISSAVDVPFIDLIEIVDRECVAQNWKAVGLLGTGYTMRSAMYPDRLAKSGIEVLVPDEPDLQFVHDVIYDELTRGIVSPQSREGYLAVIGRLVDRGAEAIVLGCTEIGLMLRDGDASVPLLDTTISHCQALVEFMLSAPSGSPR